MDFCQSMDSIDQPDRHGKRDCPPAKGFGLIMMSAWVMPMFIVPVSLLLRDMGWATDYGHIDRNREIIISNSMPEPRRESGFTALTRTFPWTTRTSPISEIPAAR